MGVSFTISSFATLVGVWACGGDEDEEEEESYEVIDLRTRVVEDLKFMDGSSEIGGMLDEVELNFSDGAADEKEEADLPTVYVTSEEAQEMAASLAPKLDL